MKLLYVLLNGDSEILLQKTALGLSIPSSGLEVDSSYGFDLENENLWFCENCGLSVFRRYVFFCRGYCVAVFELEHDSEMSERFLWVNYEDSNAYIRNEDEQFILQKVIENYNYSKNVPWVNKNGFRPYIKWVQSVAKQKGFSLSGDIKQIKNAYVSSLFTIPTSIGDLFLKIPSSTYVNAIESIEQFLVGELFNIPEIIGVSPDKRAFLTKEMKGEDLAKVEDTEMLETIVKQWAILQQRYTKDNKLFANKIPLLHNYSPKGLLERLDQFKTDLIILFKYLQKTTTPELLSCLDAKFSGVKRCLQRLTKFKIPDTLCHGDLRPGNIRVINGTFALYDWGMSIYAHPFYDLLHFLHVIRRQLSNEAKDRIMKAYLSQWMAIESNENLLEAFTLLEQLGDFFMTIADGEWLLAIIKASDGSIKEYSMDDWLFSRRSYYFSRVFDRFMDEAKIYGGYYAQRNCF